MFFSTAAVESGLDYSRNQSARVELHFLSAGASPLQRVGGRMPFAVNEKSKESAKASKMDRSAIEAR
jgi:hypothetical protein